MGQYSPCDINELEEQTKDDEDDFLKFASNNTKSWKKINENAFISELSQGENKNYDIFCIIEGNNGNEITQFVKNHFIEELLKEINSIKIIDNAIKETFLKMNKLIKEENGLKEIVELRKKNFEEESKNFKKIIGENNDYKFEDDDEEEDEIIQYTGCTLCLVLINKTTKKLHFGNIGNSEVIILKEKNNSNIILNSKHRPLDDTEKSRIKNDKLIINGKLYGILKSSRTIGNFGYSKKEGNSDNNIIIAEPDIQEYAIDKDDEYIFIANEAVINMINKDTLKQTIKEVYNNSEGSLNTVLNKIFEGNIPNYFFNNDTKKGFDTMTCTLIKL